MSRNGFRVLTERLAFVGKFITCHSEKKSKKIVDTDNLLFVGGKSDDFFIEVQLIYILIYSVILVSGYNIMIKKFYTFLSIYQNKSTQSLSISPIPIYIFFLMSYRQSHQVRIYVWTIGLFLKQELCQQGN